MLNNRVSMHDRSHARRYFVGLVVSFGVMLALLLSACGPASNAEEPTTWSIEGPLLAWEGTLWIIDATPIVVPSELGMDERRWLGAIVTASGTFDDTGQRVAEQASVVEGELPNSTLPAATISGALEAIDGAEWIVGGSSVLVPDGTHIDGDHGPEAAQTLIQPGSMATIEGYALADGRVLAVNVVLRQAGATEDPAVDPAAEPTPTSPTEAAPPANSDDADNNGGDDGDDGTEKHDKGKDKKEKQEKPDNGKHTDHDDEGATTTTRITNDRMLVG